MKRALTLLGVLSENGLVHQDDVIEIIKVAFEEGQSNPKIIGQIKKNRTQSKNNFRKGDKP